MIKLIRYHHPPFVKHVLAPQNEFDMQKNTWSIYKSFGNWEDPHPYWEKLPTNVVFLSESVPKGEMPFLLKIKAFCDLWEFQWQHLNCIFYLMPKHIFFYTHLVVKTSKSQEFTESSKRADHGLSLGRPYKATTKIFWQPCSQCRASPTPKPTLVKLLSI